MKLLQWDGLAHFREECRESLTHMGSRPSGTIEEHLQYVARELQIRTSAPLPEQTP